MAAAVLIVTFASGFALGYGTHRTPSAALAGSCNWGTLPTYPTASMGSVQGGAGITYRVYGTPFSQVVRFYRAGAGQSSWTFTQTSTQGAHIAVFRAEGPNGCHGTLTIQAQSAGETIVAGNPQPAG